MNTGAKTPSIRPVRPALQTESPRLASDGVKKQAEPLHLQRPGA